MRPVRLDEKNKLPLFGRVIFRVGNNTVDGEADVILIRHPRPLVDGLDPVHDVNGLNEDELPGHELEASLRMHVPIYTSTSEIDGIAFIRLSALFGPTPFT